MRVDCRLKRPTEAAREPSSVSWGRALKLALLGALLLSSTACIEISQLIRIQRDGSGEIVQTFQISEAFIEAMKKMSAEQGEAAPDMSGEELAQQLSQMEDQAREGASKLGEGVRFVSAKQVGTEEAPGVQVTLAFDDITKINLSQMPLSPDAMGAPGSGAEDSGDDEDSLKFQFSKEGKKSTLKVRFFEDMAEIEETFANSGSEETAEASPELEQMGQEMLEMFKPLLTGLKIGVDVEVVGKLLETNSPYVDGNTVTLFEIDFGKLFEDEEKLKRLNQVGEPSLALIKKLLQDIPGMKINLEPEVEISFSG